MFPRLWCLFLAAGLRSDCSAREDGEHGSTGNVLEGQRDAIAQQISSSKHSHTAYEYVYALVCTIYEYVLLMVDTRAPFACSVDVVVLLCARTHCSRFSQENLLCQFFSSMLSGFANTVVSLPVDIAKTRIQIMKPPHAGQPPLHSNTLVLNIYCILIY